MFFVKRLSIIAPCASISDLLIAQFFFFGNILRKNWNRLSSLLAMKIPKWLTGWLIFTRLLKKLEILTYNSPSAILSKTRFLNLEKNFDLRMVWHKIKQINASLRFKNVVLLCIIKVINISSEQQKRITFTDKTTHLSIKTDKTTSHWMLDLRMN